MFYVSQSKKYMFFFLIQNFHILLSHPLSFCFLSEGCLQCLVPLRGRKTVMSLAQRLNKHLLIQVIIQSISPLTTLGLFPCLMTMCSLLPLGIYGLPEVYHCIHPKPNDTQQLEQMSLPSRNRGAPPSTSLGITEKHHREIHNWRDHITVYYKFSMLYTKWEQFKVWIIANNSQTHSFNQQFPPSCPANFTNN